MKKKEEMVLLKVMKPFTEKIIAGKNAPRLDTLNGKTVCELSGGWRTDKTFPAIRDLLKKQFPGVQFIPYSDMPPSPHSSAYKSAFDKTIESVREKRCDAVLVGNGG